MKQKVSRNAEKYMKNHKRKSRWYKLVTGLACVVVFCTTYALILPAITMEGKTCGLEEHTHTDECYTQVTSVTRKVPICTVEGLNIHQHTEDCYDENHNLICGYADFVAHKHDESCYREDGTLWCPLEEIEPHEHDESCYTLPEPHVHTDECYTLERGDLICTEHVHTDACYTEETGLVCGLEESEGHQHSESCNDENGDLICGQEEREGHHHSDSCYGPVKTLTCGYGDHVHTDACYEQKKVLICTESTDPITEPVLICDKPEIILHTHTEDCYDKHGNLTCGQIEIKEHKHTAACFREEEIPVDTETLTCTLPEDENHTHGPRCYGTWELTCGKEEHEHTLACYADPEADVETEEDWVKTFASVTLTGDWRKDAAAIARTQLGYTESEKNYTVLEDGETMKGYTRYGAWYGQPYEDWNGLFAAFCLNYGGAEITPQGGNAAALMGALGEYYVVAQDHVPQAGEAAFLDRDEDGTADLVGIVTEVTRAKAEETEAATPDSPEAAGEPEAALAWDLKVIAGDVAGEEEDAVREFSCASGEVLGYGVLPRAAKPFTLTAQTEGGIIVTITGMDSSLPYPAEEITITAEEVKDEESLAIRDELLEESEEGTRWRLLLDITLWHGEEEIEPTGPVQVSFGGLDIQGLYPEVYHIDTEKREAVDMGATRDEEGNVILDTEHFSFYSLGARAYTPISGGVSGTLKSGGSYQLTEDAWTDTRVEILQDTVIDLNGHVLYYNQNGSGDFLTVKSGTLTILDSATQDVQESSGGSLVGNKASLNYNGNSKPQTLTYHVTESKVVGTGTTGIGTEETRKTYKVAVKGCIVGQGSNCSSIVKVDGGTFTLQGGLLTNTHNRVIYNKSTMNITGGYIAGGNAGDGWGGGIYSDGGIVTMTGGVIAGNEAKSGGGIALNGGTFKMSGGVISGNWCPDGNVGGGTTDIGHGGGVFGTGTAITLSDKAYITNNYNGKACVKDDGSLNRGNGCHGGGGLAIHGGTLKMTGGYVTGNYSKEAGGGLYVGAWNNRTEFTMSGGIVASNVADTSEGGGIRISGGDGKPDVNQQSVIQTDGLLYITNNTTNSDFDWGGGGIFVQEGAQLTTKNVLATRNKAGGFGAGVASCPTGETLIVHDQGAAIFDNTMTNPDKPNVSMKNEHNKNADNDVALPDYNANYKKPEKGYQDYFCVRNETQSGYISLVTGQMIGGGASEWRGSCDKEAITVGKTGHAAAKYLFGLTSDPDQNAKDAAVGAANVIITGNTSFVHGGGIMTNGGLIIGNTNNVETTAALKLHGKKGITGLTEGQSPAGYTFELLDENREKVGEAKSDAYGNFTITSGKTYHQAGTYTYYIREKQGDNTDISYDKTEYTATVVIRKEEVALLGVTFTSYEVGSISISPALPATSETFKVHYKANGWNGVRMHIWGNNAFCPETSWPGLFLEAENGWYTYEFIKIPESGTFNAIFSNQANSAQKTAELKGIRFSQGGEIWINPDGSIYRETYKSITTTANADGTYDVYLTGNTFTNEMLPPMQLQLIKTDADDGRNLEGAEFELKAAGAEGTGTRLTTDEKGIVTFDIHRKTTYWLWETKAPRQHIAGGPWILEVDEEGKATLFNATETAEETLVKKNDTGTKITGIEAEGGTIKLSTIITNEPTSYVLPVTGGGGSRMYTVGGLLTLMTAAILGYCNVKRRKGDAASS